MGWSDGGVQDRHIGSPHSDADKEMDRHLLASPKLPCRANWERHAIGIKTPWTAQEVNVAKDVKSGPSHIAVGNIGW